MKQILKDNVIRCELINIENDIPILEYLKDNSLSFRLQHVDDKMFEILKNADYPIYREHNNYVAAYRKKEKNHNFRWGSFGLKLSDHTKHIGGSFIIEDERIIYEAGERFFEERDFGKYSNLNYYTTMTMKDLLIEELNKKRKLLVYMGEKLEGVHYTHRFEEVSKDELMEYATNPKKGEMAYTNRIYY